MCFSQCFYSSWSQGGVVEIPRSEMTTRCAHALAFTKFLATLTNPILLLKFNTSHPNNYRVSCLLGLKLTNGNPHLSWPSVTIPFKGRQRWSIQTGGLWLSNITMVSWCFEMFQVNAQVTFLMFAVLTKMVTTCPNKKSWFQLLQVQSMSEKRVISCAVVQQKRRGLKKHTHTLFFFKWSNILHTYGLPGMLSIHIYIYIYIYV